MERKILKKMHRRLVKSFLDIIILTQLRNGYPMSGYDIIEHVHDRFYILVSSGSIYSLLYSLEREGLIEGMWAKRKRVYKLTEKGDRKIEAILSLNDKTIGLLVNFLKG